MQRFDIRQHVFDICAVAGKIGAREAIVFAGAAAEMRHRAMPSPYPDMGHEAARIMAVGAAFQAMEQHHDRRAGPAIHPVEIEKIAVR